MFALPITAACALARLCRATSPFTSLRLASRSTTPTSLSALRVAAALLVPAIFIGALGLPPASQAQQAAPAAAADPHNAAPPPKTETPPPAESTTKPAADAGKPADAAKAAADATKPATEAPKESTAEILARIANSGLPERGAHNAKVTIVFFDDMQCPYSGFMYATLFDEVMKDYADRARVVWKSFPLAKIHPWALRAAIDGECLAAQNRDAFWEFADAVHSKEAQISADPNSSLDQLALESATKFGADLNVLNQCLAAQPDASVKSDIADAKALAVKGTPTLFVNGERVYGSVSAAKLRSIIDQFLSITGPSVSPVVASPKELNGAERNDQVLPVDFSRIETGLRFTQPITAAPALQRQTRTVGGRMPHMWGLGTPTGPTKYTYEEKRK